MKKVFIDANILIDYLSLRSNENDQKLAIAIIHYCYTRLEKAFISTHSFMVLLHVLDQQFVDKSALKQKLERVYNLFNVTSVTELTITNYYSGL